MDVPESINIIYERYAANFVLEPDNIGGCSVIVWAGIHMMVVLPW